MESRGLGARGREGGREGGMEGAVVVHDIEGVVEGEGRRRF
jgi:hypothetical protein